MAKQRKLCYRNIKLRAQRMLIISCGPEEQAANLKVRVIASRLKQPVLRSSVLRPMTPPEPSRPSHRPAEERPSTSFRNFLIIKASVAVIVLLVFILVHEQVVRMMVMVQTEPAKEPKRLEQPGKCVLPAYPEHGFFIISNAPDAKPGESFESLKLTVNCLPGYGVLETEIIICLNGAWSDPIPKCVHYCKLDKNPSVDYRCLVTGSIEGSRDCNAYEPSGTVVRTECNPNYYSVVTLPFMRCLDNGSWNNVAVCSPECGRVTPKAVKLMIGGRRAKRGELPWLVGIYRKDTKPYMQICSGSLVSTTRVIAAAHCFWDDVSKQLPASQFAVAAGKIYRPWNNPRDVYAQKSSVKEIKIPPRFQGAAANFQDDVAVIILETAFVYTPFVGPACLSFDHNFNQRKLQPGKLGKVAGWGLTAANGSASKILKVVELPYVSIQQCIATSPPTFIAYITSDKICAGYENGTALCKGDSGGGLVFAELERGTYHYYLLGVASTAPTSGESCNSNALTTFTHLERHEHFIREHL